jgi:rhodanese-related sulfurtransferase
MTDDRPPIPNTRPADLLRRLRAGERTILLDVREADERAFCRIAAPPGLADLHFPLSTLTAHAAQLDEALGPEPRPPIVVYCHHGVRSMMVASWLTRRGHSGIENLDGGIDAWSVEADPSVRRY